MGLDRSGSEMAKEHLVMIRKAVRRGKPVLVIDIHFRRKDGSQGRYRMDSQGKSMADARAEERRILQLIATHGEPFEPRPEPVAEKPTSITFRDAVEAFRLGKAKTNLKPTTRKTYDEALETRLLPRFGEVRLDELGRQDIEGLDASLVEEGCSASRRRNIIVVLRSVLRAAVDAGHLVDMPRLPRLPRVGRKVLRCPSPSQIQTILGAAKGSLQLAIALAAYAGLRSGEIRALRWCDVSFSSMTLVVRHAMSRGEISTPKSGHEREIPIAAPLLALLRAAKGAKDEHVTTTYKKQPWGEFTLRQAFQRICKKVGIEGFRFHDLRHFCITQLFRTGAPAPVVQRLAGHADLGVTQRYAHVDLGDLHLAVSRLG